MRNLEDIEQTTLSYLKQVSNPLVTLEQLTRHLQQRIEDLDVSEAELIEFLDDHELFTVFRPMGMAAESDGAQLLSDAGVKAEVCVMLETRVPTQTQLAEMFAGQFGRMREALQAAQQEAAQQNDEVRAQKVRTLLARLDSLEQRLKTFG